MQKLILLLTSLVGLTCYAHAQSVTIGAATPAHASSVLDVRSSTKGLLVPRMSQTERDQIQNPADGLLIYQNTGIPGFYNYDQTTAQWKQTGDNLGNHVLTQNITTGIRYLSRVGGNAGLQFSDDYGSVRFRGYNTDAGGSGITHDIFRLDKTGGFVFINEGIGLGLIPASGKGLRFMWHPYKAAFRAGEASVDQMDDSNIGFYTFAGGYDAVASGVYSLSFGDRTRATNQAAVAFGSADTSSGAASFSAGANSRASGTFSIAMGNRAIAAGQGSVGIGYGARAYNDYSVAIGYRANSSSHLGTLAMSDASTTDTFYNTANNQFAARYASGYRFYSNASLTSGVVITPGGNSWSSISDSTKKENFLRADGESFLAGLRELKLGSWNYKGQTAAGYRHYGPMAQEIFAAYGKDALGTIGCDTLLGTADMDGVMMVLLQALEKRSSEQAAANTLANEKLALLEKAQQQTNDQMAALTAENQTLKEQLAKVLLLQEQLLGMQLASKNDGAVALKTEVASKKNK